MRKKIPNKNKQDLLEYEDYITNKVVDNVKKINNAIENNNFEAKEGSLCNWCYYWKECTAKQKKKQSNPAIYLD